MRLKLFFSSIFILLSSSPILALEEPRFTSCANPSGQIQVSWQEGVHGIVGRSQARPLAGSMSQTEVSGALLKPATLLETPTTLVCQRVSSKIKAKS